MEAVSASTFPSLQRRGVRAIKKYSRSETARTGWSVRRNLQALTSRRTSIEASPYRARASRHPVCGASVASPPFITAAATPPLRGGECAQEQHG